LAKGSTGTILAFIFLSLLLTAGLILSGGIFLIILTLLSWAFSLFVIYFFRDPNREVPPGESIVVSPADGKVIIIEEGQENEFFNGDVKKVSIFMSVFSVHVNRIPVSGKVTYFNYSKGKFLPAFKDDASYENEQTSILIEGNKIKVLFKQIAGIIARRIVCNIREGARVEQGERFGMIKFGSRVDMVLPASVNLKIKLDDNVQAGQTIIGTY